MKLNILKLSSKIIHRQKSEETNKRLKIWTSEGGDRPFGEYAIKGARAGVAFGNAGIDLHLINDFTWLEEKYNAIVSKIASEARCISTTKNTNLIFICNRIAE